MQKLFPVWYKVWRWTTKLKKVFKSRSSCCKMKRFFWWFWLHFTSGSIMTFVKQKRIQFTNISRETKKKSKQKSKSLIIIVFHHLIRSLKRYSQSFVTFVTCFFAGLCVYLASVKAWRNYSWKLGQIVMVLCCWQKGKQVLENH